MHNIGGVQLSAPHSSGGWLHYRVGSVGGYLATHWNSANSQYLVANDPLPAGHTPSTTYQRNSTGR